MGFREGKVWNLSEGWGDFVPGLIRLQSSGVARPPVGVDVT